MKMLRLICFLQMMLTLMYAFSSIVDLFKQDNLFYLLVTLFFLLMCTMTIFVMHLLSSNYPDKPVEGSQKRFFNWLFLLNFLLLAFLFSLFFAELRSLRQLVNLIGKGVFQLRFRWLLPFGLAVTLLVFHLIILYGMYSVRRLLFFNFCRTKQFEFEKSS